MNSNINLQPIIKMLTTEVEPAYLANMLTDISYYYTQYLLTDDEQCGVNKPAAEQLFLLKRLHDVLLESID